MIQEFDVDYTKASPEEREALLLLLVDSLKQLKSHLRLNYILFWISVFLAVYTLFTGIVEQFFMTDVSRWSITFSYVLAIFNAYNGYRGIQIIKDWKSTKDRIQAEKDKLEKVMSEVSEIDSKV